MCYACNMCNRCGRYDHMKGQLGKRLCYGCGEEVPDVALKQCPRCGAALPPPFPEPLPKASRSQRRGH